jgi:hypothetical protein
MAIPALGRIGERRRNRLLCATCQRSDQANNGHAFRMDFHPPSANIGF